MEIMEYDAAQTCSSMKSIEKGLSTNMKQFPCDKCNSTMHTTCGGRQPKFCKTWFSLHGWRAECKSVGCQREHDLTTFVRHNLRVKMHDWTLDRMQDYEVKNVGIQ